MATTRRLAAILAADVAGYSRLMGADEEGTHERLKALRCELVDPKIAEHHGRIVKTTGDGLLVEFASVVDAVRCAVAVQQAMPERNARCGGQPHRIAHRHQSRRCDRRERRPLRDGVNIFICHRSGAGEPGYRIFQRSAMHPCCRAASEIGKLGTSSSILRSGCLLRSCAHRGTGGVRRRHGDKFSNGDSQKGEFAQSLILPASDRRRTCRGVTSAASPRPSRR